MIYATYSRDFEFDLWPYFQGHRTKWLIHVSHLIKGCLYGFVRVFFFFFSFSAVRFRAITRERIKISSWNFTHPFIMFQGGTLLFGVVARWPVQPVGPLLIQFPYNSYSAAICRLVYAWLIPYYWLNFYIHSLDGSTVIHSPGGSTEPNFPTWHKYSNTTT